MAGFPFTRTILYMDFDGVPGLSELAEPDIQIGQYTLLKGKEENPRIY